MEWFTAAERFTAALASSDPTPGGGAAAAHAGAMGCALALMAIQTTLKRKSTQADVKARLEKSRNRLVALKKQMNGYVSQDGEAYAAYLTAKKLPLEDPSREEAIQQALAFAASVPADTAKTAVEILKETEVLKDDVCAAIVPDVYCAKHLLQACIRCAVENIRANAQFIQNNDTKTMLEKQIAVLLKSC